MPRPSLAAGELSLRSTDAEWEQILANVVQPNGRDILACARGYLLTVRPNLTIDHARSDLTEIAPRCVVLISLSLHSRVVCSRKMVVASGLPMAYLDIVCTTPLRGTK